MVMMMLAWYLFKMCYEIKHNKEGTLSWIIVYDNVCCVTDGLIENPEPDNRKDGEPFIPTNEWQEIKPGIIR